MESRHPFTLNSTQFMNQKQANLNRLMEKAVTDCGQYPITGNRNEALKRAVLALGDVGIVGLTPQSLLHRVSGTVTTSDSHLLDLFASSLSYFEISSVRIIDQICLQIDYHLLSKLSELLEKELVHHLGVLDRTSDEMRFLLREDSFIVEKRNFTQARLEMLESVYKSLHSYGFTI